MNTIFLESVVPTGRFYVCDLSKLTELDELQPVTCWLYSERIRIRPQPEWESPRDRRRTCSSSSNGRRMVSGSGFGDEKNSWVGLTSECMNETIDVWKRRTSGRDDELNRGKMWYGGDEREREWDKEKMTDKLRIVAAGKTGGAGAVSWQSGSWRSGYR